MPSNSNYDKMNPKKAYQKQKGSDVEQVGKRVVKPRFPAKRTGKSDVSTQSISPYGGTSPSPGAFPTGGGPAYSEEEQIPLVRYPLVTMPDDRCGPWYRRNIETVPAMRRAEIIRVDITAGTYYLKRIGHTYTDGKTYELIIDGLLWNRWNHQIGAVQPMAMYDLPCALVARDSIIFRVTDTSGDPAEIEVTLDGWFTGTAGIGLGKGRGRG